MKKRIVISCSMLMFLLSAHGCVRSTDEQGRTTYSLDPCSVDKAEKQTEAAIGLMSLLGTIWPALLPVAGVAAGVYGTYKRVKPKLDTARTEANLYHTSTHTLVAIVEDIKIKQPDLWAKLKPILNDAKMSTNIQNVILALRGLPPKE